MSPDSEFTDEEDDIAQHGIFFLTAVDTEQVQLSFKSASSVWKVRNVHPNVLCFAMSQNWTFFQNEIQKDEEVKVEQC